MRRVAVGITGASGSIYGMRLLEELRKDASLELHLVVSAAGKRTLVEETGRALREVEALAHVVYDDRDVGASLASGSFRTAGMVVAPCSIKTLAALASCHADTLISRAGRRRRSRRAGRCSRSCARRRCTSATCARCWRSPRWAGSCSRRCRPSTRSPRASTTSSSHTVARVLERMGLATSRASSGRAAADGRRAPEAPLGRASPSSRVAGRRRSPRRAARRPSSRWRPHRVGSTSGASSRTAVRKATIQAATAFTQSPGSRGPPSRLVATCASGVTSK